MAQYTTQIQDWLFAYEGGYVNHPSDPGGATNFGITQRVLAAWRGHSVTTQDVRNLLKDEAAQIMKAQYWDRIFGDQLPVGLDYAVYDYAVNSGVSKAVKDLQRELDVPSDGIMGQITLAAAKGANTVDLVRRLCERRMAFLRRLSTFSTFGRGWTRRVMGEATGAQDGDTGVIDRATKLARGVENIPAPTIPAPGRGEPEPDGVIDAIKKPEMWGTGATAAGGILAAISDNPVISVAVAVVIVVASGLAAFYFIRRMKHADPA